MMSVELKIRLPLTTVAAIQAAVDGQAAMSQIDITDSSAHAVVEAVRNLPCTVRTADDAQDVRREPRASTFSWSNFAVPTLRSQSPGLTHYQPPDHNKIELHSVAGSEYNGTIIPTPAPTEASISTSTEKQVETSGDTDQSQGPVAEDSVKDQEMAKAIEDGLYFNAVFVREEGNHRLVEADESTSIAMIKFALDIKDDDGRELFQGTEQLRDDLTLSQIGIGQKTIVKPTSIIEVREGRRMVPPTVPFSVQDDDGVVDSFRLLPSARIAELKDLLHRWGGPFPEDQVLLFRGQPAADHWQPYWLLRELAEKNTSEPFVLKGALLKDHLRTGVLPVHRRCGLVGSG